jgi:competence protein ComEC
MNSIISWIAQQETFIIRDIYFSWSMLIALYAVIITSVLLLKKYEKKKLYWIISCGILMITIILYKKQVISKTEELVIFHNHRNTTLGVLENKKLKIYSKDSITKKAAIFIR